jgi:hypothetical protein
LAAQLFRARHGREPFVSLTVTAPDLGRPPSRFRRRLPADGEGPVVAELHVFTNGDRLLLHRDGAAREPVDAAPHTVVPLAGPFDLLEVHAARGGAEVTARWRRHGPAVGVVLAPGSSDPRPGRTVPIDVTVVDARGETARDWNGHVRIQASGPARLRPFTPSCEVLVARGEGRTYLTLGSEPGEVVVTAGSQGLAPGRVTLTVPDGPGDR